MQQTVEFLHERGVKLDEGLVEVFQKVLCVLVGQAGRCQFAEQVLFLVCQNFSFYCRLVFLEQADIF